jgi:hypothetical protein
MPFYQPAKEKKYTVDMNTVVPVIASFDTEGNIVPLYVRINRKAYKLKVIYCQPINSNDIYKYHCSYSDHSFYHELYLTYNKRLNFWIWQEAE